jgi:hypothetical protein
MTTTVDAREFAGMLTDVARTAGRDKYLPMLNGVNLYGSTHKGKAVLVAASTDRFSLSQAFMEAEGPKLREVFVSLDAVKRVIAWVKSTFADKSLDPKLSIKAGEKGLTFEFHGAAITEPYSEAMDVPPLSKVIDGKDRKEAPATFNGRVLAPFVQVAIRRDEYMRVVTTENRPAEILIGDNFRGLAMPVRMPETPEVPVFSAPSETKTEKAA